VVWAAKMDGARRPPQKAVPDQKEKTKKKKNMWPFITHKLKDCQLPLYAAPDGRH
jgi:hypothetical protein